MSELRNITVDEMMQAYRDMRYPIAWIAEEFGYSPATVYAYTQKPVSPVQDDYYLMQQYRDMGFSCEQIAAYFRVRTKAVQEGTKKRTEGVVKPHPNEEEKKKAAKVEKEVGPAKVEKKESEKPEKEESEKVDPAETESAPPSESIPEETPKESRPTYPGKDTTGKIRLSLVPPSIIEAIGAVRTFGGAKYGSDDNWQAVPSEEWLDALYRHLLCFLKDPQAKDPESGLSHLAHMACNLAFLIELEEVS